MNVIVSIIAAMIMFAVLVAVHEGGHFTAAKAVGVKVNEFSIGMGPLLFKKKKGDTLYSLRMLPIGGFVEMEGEDSESEDVAAFNKKPAWARMLIVAAGPVMNFIFAVIVLGLLLTYLGTAVLPVLDNVVEGRPAYVAGISAGDTITAVNGKAYNDGTDIVNAIQEVSQNSDRIDLTIKDAKTGDISEKHLKFDVGEDGRKQIGITFDIEHNLVKGMYNGAKGAVLMEKEMLKALGGLFTGGVSADDFMGPVGIVKTVDQTAQAGGLNLLYLTALLSLNLGLINIIPFPALDGGRIVMIALRKITGKAISDELEGKIHFIGIVILFGLMIYVTFNDISSLIMK